MIQIPISEPATKVRPGLAPFGLGFRPFFLLAGYSGALLILLWLGLWLRAEPGMAYYGATGWHAHEMLFGYAVAVIAGFLLTATRNWTGLPTPAGLPLALLAGLWLLCRVLPWIPGIPGWLIAVIDLAFLPLLAAMLAKPLWAGKNRVNRVFIAILLGMSVANLLIHLQVNGLTTATAKRGELLMLDLVLLLLMLVGGRVLPFFTERAIPGAHARRRDWVERSGYVLILGVATLHTLGIGGWPLAAVMLSLAAVQAIRLHGWHDSRAWRIPILWILFSGYAWLTVGFVLGGMAALDLVASSPALHALTAGAIGVFTIGMMSRVALGHTGRALQPHPAMTIAFVAVNLAVLFRVAGPLLVPEGYVAAVMLSGTLFALAFAIFAALYTPILLQRRADGRDD